MSTFEFGSGGLPPPDPFPGEYKLVRVLGTGAFGTVWEADDLHLGIKVALKTVRLPPAHPRAISALERLRNEARLAAHVKHRNVVQVHAWRVTETLDFRHFLVLDYVSGGDLAEILRAGGLLPWEPAVWYAIDIGSALEAIHRAGIVHRDVKPANVIIDTETDEARLTDFGISARLIDCPADVVGTPPYMAPEAFDGNPEWPVDVFALAATLYHLVTGRLPFEADKLGDYRDAVKRGLPDADPWLAVAPEAVGQLIRAGLRYDAAERPPLAQFVAALRAALAPPAAPAPAPAEVIAPAVRLAAARFDGLKYVTIATTAHAPPQRSTRDAKKVAPAPRGAVVHTRDRVRVRAGLEREGYLTVFNIGPTGNVALLYPDDPNVQSPLAAGTSMEVCDIEFEPPTGKEQLCAIWSRPALQLTDPRGLATDPGVVSASNRDVRKVRSPLQGLSPDDWQVVVLELDHRAPDERG